MQHIEGTDEHAAKLCASPTGAVFLMAVDELSLPPAVVVHLPVAVHLGAIALSKTFSFRGTHLWVLKIVREVGPQLVPLASSLLSQPVAKTWFARVDRSAQHWIGPRSSSPNPNVFAASSSGLGAVEAYTQKPGSSVVTSTAVGATSSALAALRHASGDYHEELPLAHFRLWPTPTASVFEINDAQSWHRLCSSFPANDSSGRLVPDWNSVVREWDGIHLTFGGLLSSDLVAVESHEGVSQMRFWEFEQTQWLRWCFDRIEELPEIVDFPEPPLLMPLLPALFPLEFERSTVRYLT